MGGEDSHRVDERRTGNTMALIGLSFCILQLHVELRTMVFGVLKTYQEEYDVGGVISFSFTVTVFTCCIEDGVDIN